MNGWKNLKLGTNSVSTLGCSLTGLLEKNKNQHKQELFNNQMKQVQLVTLALLYLLLSIGAGLCNSNYEQPQTKSQYSLPEFTTSTTAELYSNKEGINLCLSESLKNSLRTNVLESEILLPVLKGFTFAPASFSLENPVSIKRLSLFQKTALPVQALAYLKNQSILI